MTLLYVAVGVVLAALPGVYLPGAGWPLPVGVGCLVLWLGLLFGKRSWRFRPAVLGAALALLWLTAYGALFHAPAQAMEHRTVRLEAVVAEWPEETGYGCRVIVRAGEEDGRKVKAIFYGDSDLLSLRPGDRLSCVARCTPADRMGGEESLYYTSKGILLKLKGYGPIEVTKAQGIPPRYALTILAGTVRERIDQLYPEKQAGFLRALLTGDKSGLDQVDQNNFKRVGLSHVVVISGLHVSFLVGFLTLFLKPEKRGALAVLLYTAPLITSILVPEFHRLKTARGRPRGHHGAARIAVNAHNAFPHGNLHLYSRIPTGIQNFSRVNPANR